MGIVLEVESLGRAAHGRIGQVALYAVLLGRIEGVVALVGIQKRVSPAVVGTRRTDLGKIEVARRRRRSQEIVSRGAVDDVELAVLTLHELPLLGIVPLGGRRELHALGRGGVACVGSHHEPVGRAGYGVVGLHAVIGEREVVVTCGDAHADVRRAGGGGVVVKAGHLVRAHIERAGGNDGCARGVSQQAHLVQGRRGGDDVSGLVDTDPVGVHLAGARVGNLHVLLGCILGSGGTDGHGRADEQVLLAEDRGRPALKQVVGLVVAADGRGEGDGACGGADVGLRRGSLVGGVAGGYECIGSRIEGDGVAGAGGRPLERHGDGLTAAVGRLASCHLKSAAHGIGDDEHGVGHHLGRRAAAGNQGDIVSVAARRLGNGQRGRALGGGDADRGGRQYGAALEGISDERGAGGGVVVVDGESTAQQNALSGYDYRRVTPVGLGRQYGQ